MEEGAREGENAKRDVEKTEGEHGSNEAGKKLEWRYEIRLLIVEAAGATGWVMKELGKGGAMLEVECYKEGVKEKTWEERKRWKEEGWIYAEKGVTEGEKKARMLMKVEVNERKRMTQRSGRRLDVE